MKWWTAFCAAILLAPSLASAATLTVGVGKMYAMPSQAIAAAHDGDTIAIDAGTYTNDFAVITASNLTLQGVGGKAHLAQSSGATIPNGKAIWVTDGANTTIDGIEFSGGVVPDQNGAGIRGEAAGLTIRNSYFHDNQMGILTADNANSDVDIQNTEFANNGWMSTQAATHNVYIGVNRSLVFRFNHSHHANVGHLLKTRALANYIEYNRIMDEGGDASFQIDMPVGGDTYLIGNVVEKGPNTSNTGIAIAYDEEGAQGINPANPIQSLYAINNTVVNDAIASTDFFAVFGQPAGKVQDNLLVGPGTPVNGMIANSNNLQTTSPNFVNQAAYDYHLTSSSPAIDKGVSPGSSSSGYTLTPAAQYVYDLSGEARSLSGAALDDGAFEFAGGGTATAPTASLTANPTSINAGQSSTLMWSSTDATSCSGGGFTASGTSGSAIVTPPQTTLYGVTCNGPGGSASASATVTVNATAFQIGQRVVTTGPASVRNRPRTNGSKVLCTQPAGALGTIVNGPQNGSGATWWNVNYDTGCDGWTAQSSLGTP